MAAVAVKMLGQEAGKKNKNRKKKMRDMKKKTGKMSKEGRNKVE